jgi:hypothetical protein
MDGGVKQSSFSGADGDSKGDRQPGAQSEREVTLVVDRHYCRPWGQHVKQFEEVYRSGWYIGVLHGKTAAAAVERVT